MACNKENEINATVSKICAEFNNDPEDLIAILHKTQGHFGYLPNDVQHAVADHLRIPRSKVYGVVTFYSFFNLEPRGKNPISICMGTACYVKGAEKVLDSFEKNLEIKNGETTKDGKFSLITLRCIGACGLAPVLTVGEKVYGHVTADEVPRILQEYK